MTKGEFELISEIKNRFGVEKKNLLGIGDDCAILPGKILVTTDALVDGVHFLSDKTDFADLGYKSLAVSISDVAAMGGYPQYAVLTMGISQKVSDAQIAEFIRGVSEIKDEFGFEIVGGDTVKSDTLFISVTLYGKAYQSPFLRRDAQDHDLIYISGSVGDSAIGLGRILSKAPLAVEKPDYFLKRHYRPNARVKLAHYLAKNEIVHACIDVSDGVLGDLSHIAKESGLGFFLEMNELPLSKSEIGEENLSGNEEEFYRLALTGGEDYELLFTVPDALNTKKIFEKTGVKLTPVGMMREEGREIRYFDQKIPAEKIKSGWTHF